MPDLCTGDSKSRGADQIRIFNTIPLAQADSPFPERMQCDRPCNTIPCFY